MSNAVSTHLEVPFTHRGYQGRVIVTLEKTLAPPVLGAPEGALGLANCKATMEFTAGGYWFGITPTLFDAPSRAELDWIADSFLAMSPLHGDPRTVTPLLGFSWGFHIFNAGNIVLKPITALTAADWEAHLPYLRKCYKKWHFEDMSMLAEY